MDTAVKLVRLAVDSAAAPGEASNAAIAACRLIHKHGLLKSGSKEAQEPREPFNTQAEEPQWRIIITKFKTKCMECGGTVGERSNALWKKGTGVKCMRCARK